MNELSSKLDLHASSSSQSLAFKDTQTIQLHFSPRFVFTCWTLDLMMI